MEAYFLDTYALIEIASGNPNYSKFSKECKIATNILNLMEFYYRLIQTADITIAKKYYYKFTTYCIEINDDIIMEACEFKLENKKNNFSYVDCIGYIIAKKTGAKFVTGDKEFRGLQNVEYVK